jgi:hypothetical protein
MRKIEKKKMEKKKIKQAIKYIVYKINGRKD